VVVEKWCCWCWCCFVVVVVDVVAVGFVEIEKKKMVGARGNFELVEKRTCLVSRDLGCLPAIPNFLFDRRLTYTKLLGYLISLCRNRSKPHRAKKANHRP
jgi:hypothetical protein